MSDSYSSLTVVLEKPVNEEHAEQIIEAISLIRGVLSVDKHVMDITEHIAQRRAFFDLQNIIWEALRNANKGF